jgi:hypothetical protein
MVDPVTSLAFRLVARGISSAQQLGRRGAAVADRHDSYAHADAERPAIAGERLIGDRPSELFGQPNSLDQAAMFQQHTELIAAQTGQRVAGAHPAPEQAAEIAQELVSCVVAAGVVDSLEAVQVEEAERVPGSFLRCAGQSLGQAPLELGAVDQARQGVMGCLMR